MVYHCFLAAVADHSRLAVVLSQKYTVIRFECWATSTINQWKSTEYWFDSIQFDDLMIRSDDDDLMLGLTVLQIWPKYHSLSMQERFAWLPNCAQHSCSDVHSSNVQLILSCIEILWYLGKNHMTIGTEHVTTLWIKRTCWMHREEYFATVIPMVNCE